MNAYTPAHIRMNWNAGTIGQIRSDLRQPKWRILWWLLKLDLYVLVSRATFLPFFLVDPCRRAVGIGSIGLLFAAGRREMLVRLLRRPSRHHGRVIGFQAAVVALLAVLL